jgi:DNA topoisomerase-1
VTLDRALEVIRLKQEADANRIIADLGVDNIQVLNGRYGPYITDGKKNAKVPKDREPKSLTLDECRALLAQAPERGKGRWGRRGRGAKAPAAANGAHAAAPRRVKSAAQRSNGAKAGAAARRPASAKEASKSKPAARKPAARAPARAAKAKAT